MTQETPHKRYRRWARRMYRVLILVCVFVLILAIIAFYYYDLDL